MNMIRTALIATLIVTAGIFIEPADSFSQPSCGWRDRRPYGGYCRGPRWGWYGAKSPVKTAEDARKLLKKYFEGEDVAIGAVNEREWYFEAEIKDKSNKVVDVVIIDKRTGRIRSIY